MMAWAVIVPRKEIGMSDTGGLAGHLMPSVRHLEFIEKVAVSCTLIIYQCILNVINKVLLRGSM